MSFKDLPSWLKGGIIGGSIGVILSVFILLIKMSSFIGWIVLPLLLFYLVAPNCSPKCSAGICPNPNYCSFLAPVLIVIFSVICYFLFGALIGWIVGKIKSSKGEK